MQIIPDKFLLELLYIKELPNKTGKVKRKFRRV